MSKTVWIPFVKHENRSWVTKDLRVVKCPPLEQSSSGRRTRIAGQPKSFFTKNLEASLKAAINPWFEVRPPRKEEVCLNPTTSSGEILRAGTRWKSPDLPLFYDQIVKVEKAYWQSRWRVEVFRYTNSGYYDNQQQLSEHENPIEALQVATRIALEWADTETVEFTPPEIGKTLELDWYADLHPADFKTEIAILLDAGENAKEAREAFMEFRKALSRGGLVLDKVSATAMHQLLMGQLLIVETDERAKHVLEFNVGTGAIGIQCLDHPSAEALQAYEEALIVAQVTGRTEDFRHFLTEWAKNRVEQLAKEAK